MKRRLLAILLVLLMLSSLSASAFAAKNDTVELLIGGVTSMNAKDAVTKFIELVGEYSGGTITCVDFPDNQLGNDEQRWEMTQTGECDISIGSTSSVASSYNDFYIFPLPPSLPPTTTSISSIPRICSSAVTRPSMSASPPKPDRPSSAAWKSSA